MIDIFSVDMLTKLEGNEVYWSIDVRGDYARAECRKYPICVLINLRDIYDVERKLKEVESSLQLFCVHGDDTKYKDIIYDDLREKITTLSNLSLGGENVKSKLCEGKEIIYKDGERVVVTRRKKIGVASNSQIEAAKNASKYAHTPSAEKKRSKSMKARRDAKIIGEI